VIGLDTNILVRFIVEDDPDQSVAARSVINGLSEADPGYVSLVAITETVWVLERAYRRADAEIAMVLERLLQVESLVVQSEHEVFSAMIALKEGKGAFADALIAALGARAGCRATLTFDRKALRLPGFQHP
jgi:predicted nucleic-acid-binding protein